MALATLSITVKYDANKTDAESLATAADKLLETALSVLGTDVLDDYGKPTFGSFAVLIGDDA